MYFHETNLLLAVHSYETFGMIFCQIQKKRLFQNIFLDLSSRIYLQGFKYLGNETKFRCLYIIFSLNEYF